jgi:acyl CoA:acetate/3-ketoacid CoA transferase beta subunit
LVLIYKFYITIASSVKGGGHKILDRCTLPLTGQTFGQDRYDRTDRRGDYWTG